MYLKIFLRAFALIVVTLLQANAQTSTTQTLDRALGTWEPYVATCTSTNFCCCSTSPVVVTKSSEGSGLVLTGDLDGGAGCRGFASIGAVFAYFPYITYAQINSTSVGWSLPMYNDQYIATAIDNSFNYVHVTRLNVNPPCVNRFKREGAEDNPTGGWGGPTPRGRGAYDSKGTAITSQQNGTFTPPGSVTGHLMRYGILRASTLSDQYTAWLIIDPKTDLGIKLTYADIHFNAPVSTGAVTGEPINREMATQDNTYKRFRYGNITLKDGQSIRYSFTYQPAGSTTPIDTPTYVFTTSAATTITSMPGAVPGVVQGNSNCAKVCTDGPPSDDTKRLYRFLGTYTIDSSRCTSSTTCCCGVGTLTATAISGDTSKVKIVGSLDGGASCGGQTSQTGEFTIMNDNTATFRSPDFPVDLTVTLNSAATSIEFGNSLYTCKTYANRATGGPSSMPSTVQNCVTPSTCGSSPGPSPSPGPGPAPGPSPSPMPDYEPPVCETTPVSAEVTRLYRYLGTYSIDPGRCSSSQSCCCAIGLITASQVPGSSSKVRITGYLDGSSACLGQTSVTGDFNIQSDTDAKFEMEGYPVSLSLKLNSDAKALTFSNSMYNCLSYATRLSGGPSETPTEITSCTGGSITDDELRGRMIGSWKSDGTCKPSQTCCCLQGMMSILAPAQLSSYSSFSRPDRLTDSDLTDPGTLLVYGAMDGGISCIRKTTMNGVCRLTSNERGSCTLQGIPFELALAGTNRLTIYNPGYRDCYSTFVRRSTVPSATVASSANITAYLSPSLILACGFTFALLFFTSEESLI